MSMVNQNFIIRLQVLAIAMDQASSTTKMAQGTTGLPDRAIILLNGTILPIHIRTRKGTFLMNRLC